MTKGYCGCGAVIDEVEYTQFKMCLNCYMRLQKDEIRIKHKNLRIRKGVFDFYYTCKTLEWNYWLNRSYPKANLIMTVEHLNNGFNLKLT